MNRSALTVVFGGALIAQALAGGVERTGGWWVVLGSFANTDLSAAHDAQIKSLRIRAARCGIDPFNDFSNKFRGFASGFDIVAVGAYNNRQTAQSVLRRIRVCVPDAYIKFGEHLGE